VSLENLEEGVEVLLENLEEGVEVANHLEELEEVDVGK